jgi:hypothetical protein
MDKDVLAILQFLQSEKTFVEQVKSQFAGQFEKIKAEMMYDFATHPVTIELDGGNSATNISGTLDGITNLYSFIGFNNGENPTRVIKEMLEASTFDLKPISNGSFEFTAKIPTAKDIFNNTPMPWAEGRSWAQGIELGISGLGYYLKGPRANSRSGSGIQVDDKIRQARFKNVPYISQLINTYNKKFKQLENLSL